MTWLFRVRGHDSIMKFNVFLTLVLKIYLVFPSRLWNFSHKNEYLTQKSLYIRFWTYCLVLNNFCPNKASNSWFFLCGLFHFVGCTISLENFFYLWRNMILIEDFYWGHFLKPQSLVYKKNLEFWITFASEFYDSVHVLKQYFRFMITEPRTALGYCCTGIPICRKLSTVLQV